MTFSRSSYVRIFCTVFDGFEEGAEHWLVRQVVRKPSSTYQVLYSVTEIISRCVLSALVEFRFDPLSMQQTRLRRGSSDVAARWNPSRRTARTAMASRQESHKRSRTMGKETIPAKARRTAEIPPFFAAIDIRRSPTGNEKRRLTYQLTIERGACGCE